MVGGEVVLLQTDNGGEGKMFKMIVSLLGLCVGALWSESHHNKEAKWSNTFWTTRTTIFGLLVKSVAAVVFRLEFQYCHCGPYKVHLIYFN